VTASDTVSISCKCAVEESHPGSTRKTNLN
jgi:hypothetical protein